MIIDDIYLLIGICEEMTMPAPVPSTNKSSLLKTGLAMGAGAGIGALAYGALQSHPEVSHQIQGFKLGNLNPWKMDNLGHVEGTNLTPQQYNQHLMQKFGVNKASQLIKDATGNK